MNLIEIHDTTMRDGNHAMKHSLSARTVQLHCLMADRAGIYSVEVGHGNGLGASSYQVGFSSFNDDQIISIARQSLKKTQLTVHVMPGFAVYEQDIKPAISLGVDIFRVGVHCTEADLSENFIRKITDAGKRAYGCLMMSHMATYDQLIKEAEKIYSYGANAVCIYDSAGAYDQSRVETLIKKLKKEFGKKVGFHGHNNLGLAVANSLTAIENGADIIDASVCGFGAGAGNTQLEILASILDSRNVKSPIKIPELYDLANYASSTYAQTKPFPSTISIVSAISGVFSGFAPHVEKAASLHGVNSFDLFRVLGQKGVVGGQEDIIYATASEMSAGINNDVDPSFKPKKIILNSLVKRKPRSINAEDLELRSFYSELNRGLRVKASEKDSKKLNETQVVLTNVKNWGELYFDGPRYLGYGGYSYSPEYWDNVAHDIINSFQLSDNSIILDVGCAKGFLLESLLRILPNMLVMGVDISSYAISKASSKLSGSLIRASATRMPLPTDYFDLCICMDMLQELETNEIKVALKEITRVSRNSILTIPAVNSKSDDDFKFFEKWAINAKSIMTEEEWSNLILECGYKFSYMTFPVI